jgi:hypothetical protein
MQIYVQLVSGVVSLTQNKQKQVDYKIKYRVLLQRKVNGRH